MTREIKFRAWDGKQMHCFDFADIYDDGLDADGGGYSGDYDYKDMPIMQFTGLKDKNGIEIYEGDILKWSIKDNGEILKSLFVVEWKNGSFLERTLDNPGKGMEDCFCQFEENNEIRAGKIKNTEVIGNVHENKYLLK